MILDGYGLNKTHEGNAVYEAKNYTIIAETSIFYTNHIIPATIFKEEIVIKFIIHYRSFSQY